MSARRRALAILVAALLLAGLSWLGAALLANTRFAFGASAEGTGEGGVRVTTAFPAATCSKTLSGDFPWVRFDCAPREEGTADAPATPLDTVPQPE